MIIRLALISGFLAFFLAAQSATPGNVRAQTAGAPTAEKQGDLFVDSDGDGYNDNAPDDDGDGVPNDKDSDYTKPADRSKARKGKWFIDEDGDGISDVAPGLQRGMANSPGNGRNKSNGESGQGETEQNGIQNALRNGLKNGQSKSTGNGLQNALERGRKVGQQDSDAGFNTPTTGNKDNVSVGNSKNRFGREYLNNNKNFNDADNKGGKGKDPGKKD
ncbi:MAG: hypothetical protein ACYC9O_17640 [Candidatus Latescibacterota bacterium]